MKKYLIFLVVLFFALAAIFVFRTKAQQCDTTTASVDGYRSGDASTLAVLDGITNDTQNLVLRLKNKGANFVPTNNYSVTTNWRMTGAAADFNSDGLIDLAEGGRETDNNESSTDTNLSIFVSQGKDPGDPNKFKFLGPYYIDYLSIFSTYEIMALGAGDYDGDGDADIAALSWQGRLWIFLNLYHENGLSPGDTPAFNPIPTLVNDLINDGYGEYGSSSSHYRWESNICSVDIDGDRDLDLIVGIPSRWAYGRYGEVVIYLNNGAGVFSKLNQTINPYPDNSTYIYGVCGVAAADFDGDGDVDFYVGSANSDKMYFYRNSGGTFSQVSSKTITIPSRKGSCTFLREGDVDNDGFPDMVLATDGWTENPPGGYVFWYDNDGKGNFTAKPIPDTGAQVSSSEDLDSGAVGDFDNDGDLDFFVADGNDSQNCYFFMNEVYPTYVDHGTVNSKNCLLCSFITSDSAVVAATITVNELKPAGTTITYYLSNSNDENGLPKWEGPVTPGTEFLFSSPGDFLRWRADFTSLNERETPKIFRLSISYKYITKREYSRTSHAFAKVDIDPTLTGNEDVLYSASFEFPKWRGHLRSWNVTNLNLSYSRASQLAEISSVGASKVQDAGAKLNLQSYDSRTVYTAYDSEADGIMNDLTLFNVANKDRIDGYLLLGEGSPEIEPLIRFVLGYNRSWKLGDINHSSPQVLNPPNGNPATMRDGYDAFKAAKSNRAKVILVGANDGMLHCFDPVTLDEIWAFIPNNLLYKLRKMRIMDPDCGEYLSHEFFVDGTPAIQDVYYGGAWHTVLVCGQGAGWGKNHQWYYFALDITEPAAPQPLWEVTDQFMGETWSVPAIARVESLGKWVAFFGSGYDNDGDPTEDIGHYFYCVDIETGQILKSMEIKENPERASPFGIQNTLPGSSALADSDRDDDAEAVYFGDLKGRLWKINLIPGISSWTPEVLYRDPYQHPIITKPAVLVNQADNSVHLYFGTGGDEKAPADQKYSFIAFQDGSPAGIEWYLGPDSLATDLGLGTGLKKSEFAEGEKVWADPVIADKLVYVATLSGNIEALNPCLTLGGIGKIYDRYCLGSQAGGTALLNPSGAPLDYLTTKQKVRSAVTVGEMQTLGQQGQPNVPVRKVFIQSYTQPGTGGPAEPPSEVLAQPVIPTALVIKSWREVYKIVR